MLGVVIPAHNEERLLPACLASVRQAARHAAIAGEPVSVVVVSDASTDATANTGARLGAQVVETQLRCVGAARDVGVRLLIEQGARWIACTDADTRVPVDWLAAQCDANADVVCGLVRFDRRHGLPAGVVTQFLRGYERRDDHRHIHGANLGFTPQAYLRAGGFPPLAAHEDVALVRRMESVGVRMAWICAGTVTTSARLDHRAPEGFGAALVAFMEGDLAPSAVV